MLRKRFINPAQWGWMTENISENSTTVPKCDESPVQGSARPSCPTVSLETGYPKNNAARREPGRKATQDVCSSGDLQKPTVLATAPHRHADTAKTEQHHRPGRRLGHAAVVNRDRQ